ncbi:Uncharacterized protein SCF082_LOCUS48889, partial [Durusdinium trenchii]
NVAKFEAWKVRRLVTVFNRMAKRGHYPREEAIRRIYQEADIPLPANPRRSQDDLSAEDSAEGEEESEEVSDFQWHLE